MCLLPEPVAGYKPWVGIKFSIIIYNSPKALSVSNEKFDTFYLLFDNASGNCLLVAKTSV
jgi:hypothetical protein